MNRKGSATEAFGQAIGHIRTVLMQPFDLARWVMLGFIAFLAYLGDGGYSFNFNFRNPFGQTDSKAFEGVREVVTWMMDHRLEAGLILFFVFLFALALGVLIQWLSSRGTFVYIDCIATNRAELARPWREHRDLADSYFFWRLVFGLCTGLVSFLLALPVLISFLSLLASGDEMSVGGVLFSSALVFATLPFLVLMVLFVALVRLTLRDFVAPVQYLRRIRCGEAMRIVLRLMRSSPDAFIVYLLLKIGIAIVVGVGVFVIGCATCCVAFCCFALPLIGLLVMTQVLQPVYVFARAFPLFFLAGFGTEFDVFGPGAPGGGLPAPPPPPPLTPPPSPPWASTPWPSEPGPGPSGPAMTPEPQPPRWEPPPTPPESVPLSDWPGAPSEPPPVPPPREPPPGERAPGEPPEPPWDPEKDGGPR